MFLLLVTNTCFPVKVTPETCLLLHGYIFPSAARRISYKNPKKEVCSGIFGGIQPRQIAVFAGNIASRLMAKKA